MALVLRTPSHRFWQYCGNHQKWFTARPVRRESNPGGAAVDVWEPRISVIRDEDRLKYTIDVDGTNPEDLAVSVREGVITIKCERSRERGIDRRGYNWREASHDSFSHSLNLPSSADWENAEASFEDGMLEISMGISLKEPKHIEIRAARV